MVLISVLVCVDSWLSVRSVYFVYLWCKVIFNAIMTTKHTHTHTHTYLHTLVISAPEYPVSVVAICPKLISPSSLTSRRLMFRSASLPSSVVWRKRNTILSYSSQHLSIITDPRLHICLYSSIYNNL